MAAACGMCGADEKAVTEALMSDSFVYGVDNPVTLHATIPVLTCTTCGFAWTDYRTEEIHDATVKQYLKGE